MMIAPMTARYEIGIFNPEGILTRLIGHRGQGPGEFEGIDRVGFAQNDSIVVLDHRLTLLSPSGTFVRTEPLPSDVAPTNMLVLDNGHVVINSHSQYGRAFALFDQHFHRMESFGPHVDGTKYDPADLVYQLTSDRVGGLWAAKVERRLELIHFDSAGTTLGVLHPSLSWFPPWDPTPSTASEDPRTVRPQPRISGVWLDPDGRLWLTGIVADKDWSPSLLTQLLGSTGEHGLPSPSDLENLYDTVIEVIDTRSGRSLGHRRYGGIIAFSSDGTMWEFVELPSGGTSIRVLDEACDCA